MFSNNPIYRRRHRPSITFYSSARSHSGSSSHIGLEICSHQLSPRRPPPATCGLHGRPCSQRLQPSGRTLLSEDFHFSSCSSHALFPLRLVRNPTHGRSSFFLQHKTFPHLNLTLPKFLSYSLRRRPSSAPLRSTFTPIGCVLLRACNTLVPSLRR